VGFACFTLVSAGIGCAPQPSINAEAADISGVTHLNSGDSRDSQGPLDPALLNAVAGLLQSVEQGEDPPPPPPPPAANAAAPAPAAPAAPGAAAVPLNHPGSSPYRSGAHGYDVSYPQCATPAAPEGSEFAVVGVNGGRAFTPNSCLRDQWSQGRRPRAVYLNTGYTADNQDKVTAACSRTAAAQRGDDAHRLAYAIGCSEAEYSLDYERANVSGTPLMWWLDVETGNSWDENDLTLNRSALQGMIDRLKRTGATLGVYSTFKQWGQITGGWHPAGIDGDWVAGSEITDACAARGFTGAPVWMAQELSVFWPEPLGFDSDYAC
jgi:hypothetical protein